jgi:hypothetical protein
MWFPWARGYANPIQCERGNIRVVFYWNFHEFDSRILPPTSEQLMFSTGLDTWKGLSE